MSMRRYYPQTHIIFGEVVIVAIELYARSRLESRRLLVTLKRQKYNAGS